MVDVSVAPISQPQAGPDTSGVDLRLDLHPLRDRLLEAGGDRLQLPWFVNGEISAEYACVLLAFGAFYPGRAVARRGADNRCHENTVAYAERDPLARTMTGFALSPDGCWRVHSWLQTPAGIVETTERRTLYYGFVAPQCPQGGAVDPH